MNNDEHFNQNNTVHNFVRVEPLLLLSIQLYCDPLRIIVMCNELYLTTNVRGEG